MEHKVIQKLNEKNSIHCVELIEKGQGENYQFLVMTLLGPSLDSIRFTLPTNKFSTYSTLVIAIQALDSLKEIHDIGFVHRDVKPANFAIGTLGTPKQRLLHVLDFGIARQYMVKDGEDGGMRLRKARRIVPFRGTLRYCSVAAQERKEQGRHDDLWSLFYMIIEFVKGTLPWTGICEEDKVIVMKQDTTELYNGIEAECAMFAQHLSVLRYPLKPDYGLLRDLLTNVFIRRNFNTKMKVDWEKGGRYDSYFEKKTSTLPSVTEKDMTEIDLSKVLNVPEVERNVTMEEILAAGKMGNEDEGLNTAQDDTIIEGEAAKSTLPAPATPSEKSKKTAKRRYVARTPSMNKVELIEKNWKKKQEEAQREKAKKQAIAARRTKEDFIVPEDNTLMKKKTEEALKTTTKRSLYNSAELSKDLSKETNSRDETKQ
uniref:Protein kinase domain-containing protein n=1 Tax=Caenorhabditis tropicalis TaxID=1561998 RepID=A0A1I7UIX1_9PELO